MKKNKTNEELLGAFIKSNKKRRQVIAEREGFNDPEKYKKFLEMAIELEGVNEDDKITSAVIDKPKDESALDMVIAFDVTSSMNSYINSVKLHVKDLVKRLFTNSPDLRLKIVAFGDYEDKPSLHKLEKAYQQSEITTNQDALIQFINSAKSTYGGDADEFYELVIHKINEETPWRKEAKKSVLLIGDADPHPIGYKHSKLQGANQIDWRQEANNAATKGIQYDTLQIHKHNDWYKELSQRTGGVNLNFKNPNKTSEIIEGLSYARSSKMSFEKAETEAMASGDEELIGAYKQMGALL